MAKIAVMLVLFVLVLGVAPRLTGAEDGYVVLKADFHVHTTYSDGHLTPTQVVDLYKSYGYDVIAITDHNYNKGWGEANAEGARVGLTIIQGEELSYTFADGAYKHIVALFLTRHIYNSAWNRNAQLKPIFDAIHAQGGVGLVAHAECPYPKPSYLDYAPFYTASYVDGWEYSDQTGVSTVPQFDTWLIGSDYTYTFDHDYHYNNNTLATRFTLVLAHNNTQAGVKEALLAGRTLVSLDGVIIGDQWVKDIYEATLAPVEPVYEASIIYGNQTYTVKFTNSTQFLGFLEYVRAGNYTLAP
jgi:3',5'-nucleoside bisphosphate phosphatase